MASRASATGDAARAGAEAPALPEALEGSVEGNAKKPPPERGGFHSHCGANGRCYCANVMLVILYVVVAPVEPTSPVPPA